jgi:hypothetical protein
MAALTIKHYIQESYRKLKAEFKSPKLKKIVQTKI